MHYFLFVVHFVMRLALLDLHFCEVLGFAGIVLFYYNGLVYDSMVHLSVQFNVLYCSPWRSKILRQRKSTLIRFVCPTSFIMQLTNVCVLIPFPLT